MKKSFSSIIFLIFFIFNFKTSLCENIISLKVTKIMRNQIVLGNIQNINTLKINSKEKTIKINPTLNDGDNLVEIIYKEPLTDCSNLLSGSTSYYADLTNFDSSQCTNFEGMFSGCEKLEKIKFGNFDTSKAENMNSMFSKCICQNIDFSILKTSKVKTMKQMFAESKIKFLDLSSFDTSNVENMEGMFYLASCISIDLSSFDTSKVTTMKQMFSTCSQLISLDISNFNVLKVQDLSQIFFSMGGKLKFCNDNPSNQILKKEVMESGLNSKENCDDNCFTNTINKFLIEKGECYESCKDTTTNLFEYNNQCYTSCPSGTEEYPFGSFFCIDSLDCTNSYYNFDKTECIDEIPEGYYCNDEEKKTIAKCQDKCQTCDKTSVENDLCIKCNIGGLYYEVENFMENMNYIECSQECPDGYFLQNEKCKKCFQNCKKCNELGNSNDNKCTECNNNMIFELGSNCYEKCPQNEYYYFDDLNQFHCSPNCPSNYKLISSKSKCIKECKDEPPYIFLYENTCLESCPPSYHAVNENNICELALNCDKYYNYEHTGCLDIIPQGFFLNNSIEKTIDKCHEKCLECNMGSVMKDLCTECNKGKNYYEKKDDNLNEDGFIQCYKDNPEGYYLDLNELIFKKCYKSCKYCDNIGNTTHQFCSECYDKYTLNGTNCYEICQYYYYFDDNFEYHCTIDENCPSDRSKLIVDKNECVEACFGDYKFEIFNKCYTSCPPNTYYNFDQTNCIEVIPEGFYLNSTQTIDKCPQKCHECNLESINNNLCINCNNALNYFKKEDFILINGYYDCFTDQQDNYYLDINNNLYKRCHKNCKSCNELGNIQNNKCTECFSNSTLNGTNCYEICQYYYYFDDSGEYICTQDEHCPNIRNKLNIDTGECIKECFGENKYEFNNICYKECPINTFYNYEHIGCIDIIPAGYYLNDSIKRTIDKCDIKCENECAFDLSTNNIICKACNNNAMFFKKEDDKEINAYYDCYNNTIEKYYLDMNNKIYKKCFDKCKYCNDKGTITEHKCTECFQGFTLNKTNCYEICQFFYYFDSNGIYHCTENENCPSEFPYKIVDKKSCIKNCSFDDTFKLSHKYICVEQCPEKTKLSFDNICEDILICEKYYNYDQTECLEEIPKGFYLNDTQKKTIDKCDIKCSKCNMESTKLNLCISCNNSLNYYQKENDILNKDNYINCYNTNIEGFYLDINNKIYKQCFEKCKDCNDKGTITEHKCTECFQGFTLNKTNCYEICQFFYYFDSNGIYHCTEENKCPNNYYFIPEKNECIINCENDDIYKYEHQGLCLNYPYIPKCDNSSMFINKVSGTCVESCEAYEFLQGFCRLRNNNKENQDFVIKYLIESIEKGKLNNNDIKEYLIMEENITYHLTKIKNDNLLKIKNNKISGIDLGLCENVLKDIYNINKDLSLIILKIDYYINYSLVPIILYEVFDPITLQKLNLSLCNNNNIIISLPTKNIDESNIYIYDPNNTYYINECSPTYTKLKFDLIISDRKNFFIGNNLTLCEKNCTLIKYDISTKKSVCSCDIKNKIIFPSMLNKNDLFKNDFSDKRNTNINIIKCASTLFSKNGIKKNIAFYIYLLLIILLIICCVQFYRKGFNKLKSYINNILILKEKKTEEEIPKMENVEEITDKANSKPHFKLIRPRTPKNFKLDFKGYIAKDEINSQDNYSNEQRSVNKLQVYNIKAKEINNNNDYNYNYNLETEINYTDLELNSFTYKEAIGIDLRYFKSIYISFIKYNHPIISLFSKNNDYNSIHIKASLIILSFSLHYFVNSIFITRAIIHKIYLSGKIYNIGLFIPYIFISFFICYILERIIRYASLSYDNIYSVYKEKLYLNAKIRANIVRKILLVKYICFYVIGFISVLFFGYYLSVFGAVYKNTQYILIKNTIISYIISLVFPFFINIITSILRRYSLKEATRQNIYNLSKYFQYI